MSAGEAGRALAQDGGAQGAAGLLGLAGLAVEGAEQDRVRAGAHRAAELGLVEVQLALIVKVGSGGVAHEREALLLGEGQRAVHEHEAPPHA